MQHVFYLASFGVLTVARYRLLTNCPGYSSFRGLRGNFREAERFCGGEVGYPTHNLVKGRSTPPHPLQRIQLHLTSPETLRRTLTARRLIVHKFIALGHLKRQSSVRNVLLIYALVARLNGTKDFPVRKFNSIRIQKRETMLV